METKVQIILAETVQNTEDEIAAPDNVETEISPPDNNASLDKKIEIQLNPNLEINLAEILKKVMNELYEPGNFVSSNKKFVVQVNREPTIMPVYMMNEIEYDNKNIVNENMVNENSEARNEDGTFKLSDENLNESTVVFTQSHLKMLDPKYTSKFCAKVKYKKKRKIQ